MFVENITLHNYVRLKEGMNVDNLSIDFTKLYGTGINRVLFFGRNGSGKTSLMNAITPFPTNGDDRAMIIPGKEGYKEITYKVNGNKVTCKIHTSPKGKTSAFMYINDEIVELTKKGNITEYLQSVQSVLSINQDYFKVGRIGNRINGFIDLGPNDRKKFIGRFMPELDEWMDLYKRISKNITLKKNDIRGLSIELDKLPLAADLKVREDTLNREIMELNATIDDIKSNIAITSKELEELEEYLKNVAVEKNIDTNKLVDLKTLVESDTATVEAINTKFTAYAVKSPNLTKFMDLAPCEAKLADITNDLKIKTVEMNNLTEKYNELENSLDVNSKKLNTKKANLSSMAEHSSNLTKLTVLLNDYTTELNNLSVTVKYISPAVMAYTDYDTASAFSTMLEVLQSDLSEIRFPSKDIADKCAELNYDKAGTESFYDDRIDRARLLKEKLDVQNLRLQSAKFSADIGKRFTDVCCGNPKCPFEATIESFRSVASTHGESKKANDRINESYLEVENSAAEKKQVLQVINHLHRMYGLFNRPKYRELLEITGLKNIAENIHTFADYALSNNYTLLDVSLYVGQINDKRKHSETLKLVESTTTQHTLLKNLVEGMDNLEEEVQTITNDIQKIKTDLESVTEAKKNLSSSIELMTKQSNVLTSLKEQIITRDKLSEDIKNNSAILELIEFTLAKRSTCKSALIDFDAKLEIELEKLHKINLEGRNIARQTSTREHNEARLFNIKGKLETSLVIQESCHPAKGIPVKFVKDFLSSIEYEVNNLLKIALNEDMSVKFDISEEEFKIPVLRESGNILKDVTEASDGQIALIKTVISVALVKQLLGTSGYNILTLDEVDNTLDKERNREKFTEIIETIAKQLNLEQIFMISHNDNFHMAPAGLILLPGHSMPIDDESFMSNKIILANFE